VAGRAPFLVLGGVCRLCTPNDFEKDQDADAAATPGVCIECSIFHGDSWFCLDCASSRIHEFPSEVQVKIQRRTAAADARVSSAAKRS